MKEEIKIAGMTQKEYELTVENIKLKKEYAHYHLEYLKEKGENERSKECFGLILRSIPNQHYRALKTYSEFEKTKMIRDYISKCTDDYDRLLARYGERLEEKAVLENRVEVQRWAIAVVSVTLALYSIFNLIRILL